MKKQTKKTLVIVLIVLTGLVFTFAKMQRISPLSWEMHKEINQAMFSNEAINGYDAVSYFTEKKAVLGDKAFSYNWKNADWHFTTEKNKALFVKNPEKYAPQYGGYCALAVSKGFTANADPNSIKIIDGKLYLFADEGVKEDWMNNYEENIIKGKENWKW